MDLGKYSRRQFMAMGAMLLGGYGAHGAGLELARNYKLALSTTSLRGSIGKDGGRIPFLEVPQLVRDEFDLDAVFLLSTQFETVERSYLEALRKALQKARVTLAAILVEEVGYLGAEELHGRQAAVQNYRGWVDQCAMLDCTQMRIQWIGHARTTLRVKKELQPYVERSIPAIKQVAEYAEDQGITILLETLGGPASDPDTLKQVVQTIGQDNLKIMPNTGNFLRGADIEKTLTALAPIAGLYTLSSRDFDELTGRSLDIDFEKAIQVIHDQQGYTGYIGLEYTGTYYTEFEGVHRVKERLHQLMLS